MFSKLFIDRPSLVFVLIFGCSLSGLFAMTKLVQQYFPTIDFPTITVSTNYPGASTTEMRDAIVRPLEDTIAGAPDLDYMTSSIQQGQATISVTFTLTSDKNADLVEIQNRVQNAGYKLPADLRSPTIAAFDPTQSTVITLIASSTSLSPGDLSAIVTNQVVSRLQQIPSVSNATPQGAVTPALVTAVDPRRLEASGSTISDVMTAIQTNTRAPGGYATAWGKETSIDVRADITSPETIAALLLPGSAASGSVPSGLSAWSVAPRMLRVRDVASVYAGFEPPRSYAFVGGHPSINIAVTKATGASEVDAANAVIAAVPSLRAQFPQIDFALGANESTNTQQELTGVEHTLFEAIVLTAIVMLFFLQSWRNALVVLVAIPTSLFVTLTAMQLFHFTLDTVSLLAMTLVIGILVDDSIVVLENIERHVHGSPGPKHAALAGAGEIGLAALVITLIIVAVFLPVAFMPGIVGRAMFGFGIDVVVATLTSLVVSFAVVPSLAGNWSLRSKWKPPWIIRAFDAQFARLSTWYTARALPWAVRRPRTIIAFSALTAAAALALLPLGVIGFEFVPAVDRGQLTVQLTMPPGTSIQATSDATLTLERYIDAHVSDLSLESALAGGSTGQLGTVNQGNVAQIGVVLKDNRSRSTAQWTSALTTALPPLIPQGQIVVIPATGMNGGTSQPISYIVTASNATDPTADAHRLAALLASTPGVQNVTDGSGTPAPQVEVHFDRDAARSLNVDIGRAAAAVRAAFGGDVVTQYNAAQGMTDVQVIYGTDSRRSLATIAAIALRNNGGNLVHLGDFTTLRNVLAPTIITRQNRATVISIGANVAKGYSQSVVQNAFTAKLKNFQFSPGVSLSTTAGGTGQYLTETVTGTATALAIAVVLVYLLMVALFNSYVSPAIVMGSVPVAFVGAFGALALTHQTLNLFSLIGVILLVALVAKNAVLLVDFANTARNHGARKVTAIVRATHVRFRPIMMTTIAMIAGMLPLALALDPGGSERQGLGIVVIGGLLSSLALTLLLVPVMYLWLAPADGARKPEIDA